MWSYIRCCCSTRFPLAALLLPGEREGSGHVERTSALAADEFRCLLLLVLLLGLKKPAECCPSVRLSCALAAGQRRKLECQVASDFYGR